MARKLTYGLTLLIAGAVAGPLCGQDDSLADTYGEGVHAFYAGEYDEALELFSDAIEGGSTDPRCLFFRGLTQYRLGNPEAAGYAAARRLSRHSVADHGAQEQAECQG